MNREQLAREKYGLPYDCLSDDKCEEINNDLDSQQEDFILEQNREWMLEHTANKSRKEEIDFELDEVKDNISDCLAKQKLGLAENLNKGQLLSPKG